MITVSVRLLTCVVSAIAGHAFGGDEQECGAVVCSSIRWYLEH